MSQSLNQKKGKNSKKFVGKGKILFSLLPLAKRKFCCCEKRKVLRRQWPIIGEVDLGMSAKKWGFGVVYRSLRAFSGFGTFWQLHKRSKDGLVTVYSRFRGGCSDRKGISPHFLQNDFSGNKFQTRRLCHWRRAHCLRHSSIDRTGFFLLSSGSKIHL